ncbi:MAG: hypothetical protein DRP50_02050 [Thermotoga sp.]|nr:MAG: hypothetical protein DRP50_02050 [Thermotoga sp.]
MYGMVTKEYVRKKYFVDGWSIRKISRRAEISRRTVRKMLKFPHYQLNTNFPIIKLFCQERFDLFLCYIIQW